MHLKKESEGCLFRGWVLKRRTHGRGRDGDYLDGGVWVNRSALLYMMGGHYIYI